MTWSVVPLADVCDVKRGTTITQKHTRHGDIPVVAGGVEAAYFHDTANRDANVITISSSGANAGFVNFWNSPIFASDCSTVTSRRDDIDISYVFYFLRSKQKDIYALRQGAAQPHVYAKDIAKLQIPLPPFHKQRRIVDLLSRAEGIVRLRREAQKKAAEIIPALFLDMFGDPATNPMGWPVKRLAELAAHEPYAIKAGPFGSALKKEIYVPSGYKIYGQEQVIRNDLTYGDYYITEAKYRELESCRVQAHDLLISLVGTFGKISVVPEEFEDGIINPRLMKITLDRSQVVPMFLKEVLTSAGMRGRIEERSHGGTMNIVNVGIMKSLDVPLPPLERQRNFCCKAEAARSIQLQQDVAGITARETFSTLLALVFSGGRPIVMADTDKADGLELDIPLLGDVLCA